MTLDVSYREVDAESDQIPVVFEIPHASLLLPVGMASRFVVTDAELRGDSDLAMDEVCARVVDVGAAYFSARYSRYVVDLNRAPDDIDRDTVPDHPTARTYKRRGVVWTETAEGRRFVSHVGYRDYLQRIAQYHAPYHRRLREILIARRKKFGFVVLVAAHSMPPFGAHGGPRAMVVPGTRGGTTCSSLVREAVEHVFAAENWSIRHDDPYRGGYCTQHYGVPEEGFHAVQIELNRALYVDGLAVLPERVATLQRVMQTLATRVGSLPL